MLPITKLYQNFVDRWLRSIIILIVSISIQTIDCQQNPTISFITKERVTSIGDTLDLSCSVQYAKNYPVIWAKIDQFNPTKILFISKGASLSVPDHRYSIRHDDASSTYTLQISKIQEIDAGIYQCQVVISPSSRVTANVNVYVKIPPVISDNSTRNMITSTGESIQLECYAYGYPQPSISWRRENNDLLPTGGSLYKGNILIIHNITKYDRGTYYCIADNSVGSGARRNVVVEVEFPPSLHVDRTKYEQAIGYDVNLQCHVESFPAPNIIWLKDGIEIRDSSNYQISVFSTSHDYTDSVLRIKQINQKHFGQYVCMATNKLATNKRVIDLIESPSPVCPPACLGSFAGFGHSSAFDLFGSRFLTISMLITSLLSFLLLR
ncbi:Lachesin [Sarcoptes scabiei]|uniref:Lachesin n=1 Tax=Sarcoptes scabiei TaxID=52283 RepID=A0A132ADD4_SARSC|nr:Lachesin [Sarcoptes scabiei]KPM08585.1 lachesin-like protein 3 [Sarcoptes scabiei]